MNGSLEAPRLSWNSLPTLYCLAAGSCDVSTGILLVTAPLLTLRLMHVGIPPQDPIFIRFIGAFVLGVGLIYLLPFFARPAAATGALVTALQASAMVRASVGLFVTASVAAGALAPAWSLVAVTDLALAAFQVALVRRGGAA